MKYLIYSDVHWSTFASLVRSRAEKYSTRLTHLINSLNWIQQVALQKGCQGIFCLGDFFDKSSCTDEELTALQEIKWVDLPQYFLCGNHESSVSDLRFSSLKVLESEHRHIVTQLTTCKTIDCNFLFLPYFCEYDRRPLIEYLKKAELYLKEKPLVILSHNEINGINYGGFQSKLGFSIQEISENCTLYLNGHLHNSQWITPTILNVGSLSAHNFTNDSFTYKYGIWILDTQTFKLEFIENPFGFNFYKCEILKEDDLQLLSTLKNNSIVSIKGNSLLVDKIKNYITILSNILEYRLVLVKDTVVLDTETITIDELQVDHLQKFIEFCKANLLNTNILTDELAEICK